MVALFSRSGSVLAKVLNQLAGNEQLVIFTNNFREDTINEELIEVYGDFIAHRSYQQIEQELMELKPQKIFLFGYMRVLSPEVCERHQIYNLHPGDISTYPDLKGIDPIEKYFSNPSKYGYKKLHTHKLGCTIHRVIEAVDEGEILYVEQYEARDYEEAQETSRELAIKMWVKYINYLNH